MFHVKQVKLELRERDSGSMANLLSSISFIHDFEQQIQDNHISSAVDTPN